MSTADKTFALSKDELLSLAQAKCLSQKGMMGQFEGYTIEELQDYLGLNSARSILLKCKQDLDRLEFEDFDADEDRIDY
jgi:hypothetical protein